MFRKEIYLSFLLSISLFLIIDISSYNYNVLGQEDDNRDSHDNNVREDKDEEEEDFEDASLNELFDDNNDDDNNNVREDKDEEEEEEDEKEEKDEVPFILPFKAVPFP